MHETYHCERALLVVVKEYGEQLSHESLAEEFRSLVISAGLEVIDRVMVKLDKPNPPLYVGKGKAGEIRSILDDCEADVVIFNSDLNFRQQRNLEEVLGVKTIDRTQLILDIFVNHARSQEGIHQVELAQLQYLLPRLRGQGIMLSRLGGGIGTRGPGEKKLEIDQRRISEKIIRLQKDLAGIKQHHEVMRKRRKKGGAFACSLVGYTNAGKTTLFNVLSQDSQIESAALFTTLDTVARIIQLEAQREVVLSDTVGFIYKLPPRLVEAFKTTLDELHYADLLLHVVDAGSQNISFFKRTVDNILSDLDLAKKPTLVIFNKIDKLTPAEIEQLKKSYPEAVFICAKNKEGLEVLKEHIAAIVKRTSLEVIVKVPFERMDVAGYLHRSAEVLKVSYQEKEAVFWLRLDQEQFAQIKKKGLSIQEI